MRTAGAQAHDCIDYDRSICRVAESEPPSDPPQQHRFQRYMVDNIRLFCAIEPCDFGYGSAGANHSVTASAPRDGAHSKAFFSDPLAMGANPGCDDDFESGRARCAGDRQPMGTEIPVLGNQEEQLWPPGRIRCRNRRQDR